MSSLHVQRPAVELASMGIPLGSSPSSNKASIQAAPKRPKRILTANVIPPILRDVLQLQASWSLS